MQNITKFMPHPVIITLNAIDVIFVMNRSYGEFFDKGFTLFGEMESFCNSLNENISELEARTSSLDKRLEKRHNIVQQDNLESDHQVQLEGYLFKRGQNAFRTWNRRWFYLQNNQLCYSKR